MVALQTAKKDLRRKIRKILQDVPKESIISQSIVATNKLLSLPEYNSAKRIGVYLSMPTGEISTTGIVQDALKHNKEVFIPYIHSVDVTPAQPKVSVMDMLALNSMEEFESLEPDKWGIPSLRAESVPSRKNCLGGHGVSPARPRDATGNGLGLDLIVMPGMAFDTSMRRLGHGKGYYDYFLKTYSKEVESKTNTRRHPFLVALALKEQILPPTEEIPVGGHDWPVDAIIVGDGRFLTSKSS